MLTQDAEPVFADVSSAHNAAADGAYHILTVSVTGVVSLYKFVPGARRKKGASPDTPVGVIRISQVFGMDSKHIPC